MFNIFSDRNLYILQVFLGHCVFLICKFVDSIALLVYDVTLATFFVSMSVRYL